MINILKIRQCNEENIKTEVRFKLKKKRFFWKHKEALFVYLPAAILKTAMSASYECREI